MNPPTYTCDHIHLRSRDAVVAARFYVETFGARETARIGTPVTRVVLDLGGLTLFIEQATGEVGPAATPPHRGIAHLGLRVPDIETAVADLRARGIALVAGIAQVNPALRTAFLDGPDGVRIEILERRAP